MRGGDDLPRGVRRLLRLGGGARDLEDELAEHFRRVEEDLVARGMDARSAAREARRRFGDERRWRGRIRAIDRSARRRRGMEAVMDGLRGGIAAAWRGLRAEPGLSLAIVLAFALGIGANATVWSILDRLLLSAPPYVEAPDDVVRLVVERLMITDRRVATTLSFVDVEDFEASGAFAAVAAYSRPVTRTVGRGEAAVRVPTAMATADFFPLLGVRPLLGRFFTEAEEQVGAPGAVVLGEGYWRRSFGGATDVLGRTVDFGQGEYVVIGVAPRGFTGIELDPVDLWVPLRQAAPAILGGEEWLNSRGAYFVQAVARLTPGVARETAGADATRLHRLGRAEHIGRGTYDAEATVLAAPLIAARGPDPSAEARVARWLAGVSLTVLLIACINVANLLFARALKRQRETAIRLALGISRGRLVADALLAGLLLAVLGGAAALAAAHWGGAIVRATLLPNVDWSTGTLSLRLVAFVFVLAGLAGAASALLPGLQSARGDVNGALRASAGGITRSALRTRSVLFVAQAALSVLLLIGAGLFVRSLAGVGQTDMGFDPDNLFVAHLAMDAGMPAEERRAYYDEAAARLAALPVVHGAATASSSPFWSSYSYGLRVPGLDSIPSAPMGGPYGQAVSPEYFATMGLRIVRGRAFTAADRQGSAPVLIVNEAFADLVWPGADPIGRCVHVDDEATEAPPCAEVVGVVETARRDGIREPATALYYLAAAQRLIRTPPSSIFVRAADERSETAAAIRTTLLSLDARVRYANVRPLLDLAAGELRPWRLGATLFTLFGVLALVVAALGLYSVLAFDVAQRARELGLRTALGARVADLLGIVLGRAAGITAVGIALGLVAAGLLAPRLEALLYEVSPRDPLTFASVAALLLAVALLAAAVPALRAARVDPNVALRAE